MADDERRQDDVSAVRESTHDGGADEAPSIVVPAHHPLPPPPTVSYTRPTPAQMTSSGAGLSKPGSGSGGDFNAASHGAGLAAGTTFIVSIIAGALAGDWMDHHWLHAATPWATLGMTLIGFATGFTNLLRIMGRSNRNRDNK